MRHDPLLLAWIAGPCVTALTLSTLIGATSISLGAALIVSLVVGGLVSVLAWGGSAL